MPEISRLNGDSDWIELDFVEREETPRELMKLGIHLHAVELSLSDTISILDKFGVKRSRSTVHNWVQKAGLQPTDGKHPDHVAVDETVIRINDRATGCTLLSIHNQRNISTSGYFRREHKRLPRCF